MKHVSKLVVLLIVMVFGLLCLTGTAQAAAVDSGTCGENLTWTLDDEGVLTISGTGAMYDYSYAKSPWYSHRASIQYIQVDNGVTSLGKDAFAACSKITEAVLPDTLTLIGDSAFYQCKALKRITIPEGVTEVGTNAFTDCTVLAQVSLPGSLRTIGLKAFCKCSTLTEVTIPEGVVNLGQEAFSECIALQTVSLPATLTQVGGRAFEQCRSLAAIIVAPGSSSFCHDSQGALYNRDKTTLLVVPGGFQGSFIIPDTVTAVEKLAASRCSGMTALHIPDSVTSIGDSAFSYCSLVDATVPRSITIIPEGCFYYNRKLQSISIPETVTEIQDSALGYCEALTAVTLPEGLQVLGGSAFWGCEQLKSIVIPEGITALDSATFYNCTKLETVKLPGKLQSIDYWCFQNCTSLKNLVLPDTLESIGTNAFDNTPSLKSIIFPASLREISAYAFKNSGLTEMTFQGDAPTFKLGMGLEEYAFGGVTATAYYPMHNPTWTEEVRQNYSGNLTWVAVDMHTHNWQDATCTAPRTCTTCGAIEGDPLGHQAFADPGCPATCTKDGLSDGSHCGRCGEILTDQMPIPALGHDWEGLTCRRCGEVNMPFVDVPDDAFFYKPVIWAVEQGITNGYGSADTFAPDVTCNRGQVVTFLWRAAGEPEPTSSVNPFTDIKESDYFYKAVLWAVEEGITAGYGSDTIFNPNGSCTRGQVATFLWRYFGQPQPASTENPFNDVKSSEFYYTAVLWAAESGITAGYGNAYTFAPNMACNRGQVVTFLYRAMN